MEIYFNTTSLDIEVSDNSYRYRVIKGEHSLTLYYSLDRYVEIPIGAYCVFENETYTLEKPENFKMHNTRNFEYTLIMESSQAKLKNYKFRNPVDGRLKFDITYKPQEYLQMLIDNLNQRESGWSVGAAVTAVEKHIAFNHTDCMSALSQIADAFETEWEIIGKTIHLHKVEYNKDKPLALSYGRGKGFKPGVGRTNFSDSKSVEVLFVQGGEKNINASEYKSKELLLPKSQLLKYDGKYFEGEKGFDATVARSYISDANGVSIRRQDKSLTSKVEDSLDLSEIYPSRVGTVTKVEVTKEGFCNFLDTTIPDILDYSKPESRFKGEKMTVIFQSGQLAGKEFDIQQNEKRVYGYIHSERRFKVAEQTIDGVDMPKGAYMPVVGDKYAVYGVILPNAYVCENATKTGASWDMFRQAVKYLYENEEPKFTFTGELDGIWAKKDWLTIGGKIRLGGYVLFSDPNFQPEGVLIRVVGIKDFINNPHSPTVDLSNGTVGSSIASDLRKIESNEVTVEQKHKDTLQFTKRRYRDTIETMEMLNKAMLDDFTNSISPVSVRTMQLIAGDESLQYCFVDKGRNDILYDESEKKWNVPAGRIKHMTMGITKLSSSHAASEYRFWDMEKLQLPALTDSSISYYIYAKVKREGTTGVFYISEEAIKMEEKPDDYHLLYGILNSGDGGERNFMPMYGFSELTPGRLTIPKIVSPDGQTYFDVENGVIGGKIVFKSKSGGDKTITELEEASEAYAKAKAEAERVNAEAYADGIVTAEEQRAMADAEKKAEDARKEAVRLAEIDAKQKAEDAVRLAKEDAEGQVGAFEETIIDGGFIKTSLINVDKLVARNICTSEGGAKVEILGYVDKDSGDNKERGNSISVYQGGVPGTPGNPGGIGTPGSPGAPGGSPGVPGIPGATGRSTLVTEINGKRYNNLDSLFGTGTSRTFTFNNIPLSDKTQQTFDTYGRGTWEVGSVTLVGGITKPSVGTWQVNIPSFNINLYVKNQILGDRKNRGTMEAMVYLGSTLIGKARADSENVSVTIPAFTSNIGSAPVDLTVDIVGNVDTRMLPEYTGLLGQPVTLGYEIINPTSEKVTFTEIAKITRMFANGFMSKYSTKKFFAVIDSTVDPLVSARGDQVYMSGNETYRIRVTDSGIYAEKKTGNDKWSANILVQ